MGAEMPALVDLIGSRRWVAWRNELRNDKKTKIPYYTAHREAQSDNPATWVTHDEAARLTEQLGGCDDGGVGIQLGPHDGVYLAGLDLDTCRDSQTGAIGPWARTVLDRFGTYAEVSPSQTGVKAFFIIDEANARTLRALMGTRHGRQFKQANGGPHPPAIELYLSNRYFAVTWQETENASPYLRAVPIEDLQWVIEEIGPSFSGRLRSPRSKGPTSDTADAILTRLSRAAAQDKGVATALQNAATMKGGSRSEGAFGLGVALKRAGWSFDDMKAALMACPATNAWAAEKLIEGDRQFQRLWGTEVPERTGAGAWPSSGTANDNPAEPPPDRIDGDWWLSRALERPVTLLGEVICATTRALLGAHWSREDAFSHGHGRGYCYAAGLLALARSR